jgi:antitoxin VapB
MLTQVFERGDSIAVPIPKELAFVAASQQVDIERVGDTLVIRAVYHRAPKSLADVLAEFPAGFMSDGREFHEQVVRVWDRPDGDAHDAP